MRVLEPRIKTYPINIYQENNRETIAYLCDDVWDLPTQIYQLEQWLIEFGEKMERKSYIADIGFSLRENSSGGGAVLRSKSMSIMGKIGMTLYFSEYPE